MNFGDCPYDECSGTFFEPVPEKTPVWAKLACETCSRPVWYKFSRFDPEAWTVEDFDANFIVDEQTKSIRERNPLQSADGACDPIVAALVKDVLGGFAKRFAHEMLFGVGHRCDECEIPAAELRGDILAGN
jgi:hypothetical protein